MVKKKNPVITSLLALLMIVAALLPTLPVLATFTASVDRTVITRNETLDLTLRVDGQAFRSEPDTTPLNKDFDILGSRQSSQFQMTNDKTESWTDWTITLAPKGNGAITIPALKYNGETSEPIHIDVRQGGTNGGGTESISPVFMQTSLSRQALYIQQETILTLKIYYSTPLVGNSSLTPLDVSGAIVQQLGKERQYEELINGKRYGVFEVQYAIHPQESGTLTIPAQTFTSNIAVGGDPYNNFFSMRRTRTIRAQSTDIPLNVQPVPPGYPADAPWLPASGLTLTQAWSSNPDDLKTGDSVTRTLTIEASGLTAAQLPPVTLSPVSNLKTYPDQPRHEDHPRSDGITGRRTEAIALVPTHPGTITLPAIRYTWFNTTTGRVEQATLPETTLIVSPGNTLTTTPSGAPVQVSGISSETMFSKSGPLSMEGISDIHQPAFPWIMATASFALLWLITLGVCIRQRNGTVTHEATAGNESNISVLQNEKDAFQQLSAACKSNDLMQIKQQLITWAALFHGRDNLYSLAATANAFDNEALTALLDSLEQDLYSGKPGYVFVSGRLLAMITDLRKTIRHQTNDSEPAVLSPLNP